MMSDLYMYPIAGACEQLLATILAGVNNERNLVAPDY